jgi:hypothetical protein
MQADLHRPSQSRAFIRSSIPPTLVDALVLTTIALLIRTAWHFLAPMPDWPDTWTYLASGTSLLSSGTVASTRVMPGYPLMLGLFGYTGIIWVQLVLSAATVGIIVILAQTLWMSRVAGLISGVLAAGYPVLVFYANMRLTETTFIFFLCAGFLAFYRGYFLVGSILLVLSILIRPAIELVAPVLIVAFCVSRHEWRSVLPRLTVFALVYGTLMSPWWLHNYHQYGSFVRLHLGDGIVMLLENNWLYDEVGIDLQKLEPVFDWFKELDTPMERNSARKAAAWAYIVEDPVRWLNHSVDRFRRFWSPSRGYINMAAVLTTIPLFATAAAALWHFASRAFLVRFGPIVLVMAYMMLVHSAFHALPRYRLPLEGFLIILSAGWLQVYLQPIATTGGKLFDVFRARSRRASRMLHRPVGWSDSRTARDAH